MAVVHGWSRTIAPSPCATVSATIWRATPRARRLGAPVERRPRPSRSRDSRDARCRARDAAGRRSRRRRAAEPRARVDAGRRDDRALGRPDVRGEPGVGQQRHPRMVVGVVPDEVPARRRSRGRGSGNASAHRPCTKNVAVTSCCVEHVEHPLGAAGAVRAVGMLGVEGQRDAEGHRPITSRRR